MIEPIPIDLMNNYWIFAFNYADNFYKHIESNELKDKE